MSKAEELLNTLTTSDVATRLADASTEPHIIIDDDRVINVPESLKRLGVQHDHNIETVTFDCPRYWDEHDMSEMVIYINYLRSDRETGTYRATDVTVDSENPTLMHFNWTISRNVTEAYGQIVFLVCIKKADDDGNEQNHWNSELCKTCAVSEGLEVNGEELRELYPDIIDQWHNEVLGVIDEVNTVKQGLIDMRDSGELDGATFTPSVSSTGDLSWTNDRGRENPETVNVRGPNGISPVIRVTDIQGGHRVTITDVNGTQHIDVKDTIIDTTEAAKELIDDLFVVSTVEPETGPVLWFDAVDDANWSDTIDQPSPVWAQIQAMIGNLEDLDTTAKNNLVAAVNEAMAKGGEVDQIKDDISDMRFGDPYYGVDLTEKFAEEISRYTDPGAWIRARIRSNNFDGIHVNDYIPFTTTNGLKFKARVAGINQYYEYGDSAVGHHIDFICEELWPTLKPINPVNYNNGLIPTENITSDGTATQYVLTKPMYGVAKVTLSGTDLTGWTYDKDTYTLTFSTAPAAGTMVVTGTSCSHPWLASDAYLYVNSLAGHVANGTGLNPAIKRVDYTNDGIYHYLPDWLKAVIIEKRFLLNKRYSATGILSDENSWGWANLGKLWFPTEVEVYGCPVRGSKGGYGLGSSIQYPLFMGNMRRLKKMNGGRYSWWLLSPATSTTGWCSVTSYGHGRYYNASDTDVAAPVCFRIG